MDTITLNQKELYELVWKQPIRRLAQEWGTSEETLKAICRRLQVPLPGQEYWQQQKAGGPAKKADLGPCPNLVVCVVPANGSTVLRGHISIAVLSPAGQQRSLQVSMSKLARPHWLVKQMQDVIQDQGLDFYGLRKAMPVPGLSLRVSPATELRALSVVDTIFKKLAKRHLSIDVRPLATTHRQENQYFSVEGHAVEFSLRESYLRRQKSRGELEKERATGAIWTSKIDASTTGKLVLTIQSRIAKYRGEWSDQMLPLEAQLEEIVNALKALPGLIRKRREQADVEARIREADYFSQRIREQQHEQQHLVFQQVLEESRSYRDYIALITYLDHLEEQCAANVNESTPVGVYLWLTEMRAQASRLDCTKKRFHQIMKSISISK